MARVDVGLLFTARDRMSGALGRMNQKLRGTEKQAKRTARGLRSIDLVIGLMATGTILAITRGFVKMGSEMEQLRTKIAVFERGFGNVDNIMGKLNEQFGKTPFSLETIGNSFVRLKASGLDPLDGSLKALLDSVAAFGGGTQELQRAGIAIQQMAGKGVISMEELRQQLGEAIPFAMRLMAQGMDKTVGQLIKAIERGEVSASVGLAAFFGEAEKTFGGVAEAMVNTMAGAFERLKKVFQGGADKIFNTFKLGPRIAATLNVISDELEKFIATITQEDVDKWADFFVQSAFLAFRLAKALAFLADVARAVIAPVVDAFNGVIDDVSLALIVLGKSLTFSKQSIGEMVAEFNNGNSSIDGFSKAVSELTEKGIKELQDAMSNVQPIVDALGLSPQNLKLSSSLAKSLQGIAASLDAVNTLPFEQKITRLRNKVDEFAEGLDTDTERLAKLRQELSKALGPKSEASADDILKLRTGIETLNEALVIGRGDVVEYNKELDNLRQRMQDRFVEKLGQRIDKLSLKIREMSAEIGGTRMQQAITDVQKKFGTVRVDLEKQLDIAKRLPIHDEDRASTIARLGLLLQANTATEERALVIARDRVTFEEKLMLARSRVQNATLRFQTESSKVELARLSDPTSAFFDTSRSDAVREKRENLREQAEQIKLQVIQLTEAARIETNPEVAASMRERLDLLKQQVPILQGIAAQTTETALLQRELWAEVGRTVTDGLAATLKDLAKGTASVEDALVSMFDRITEAAADYLVQLLLVKAAQGAMGGGFGGGGGMFGGLLGFGKGGAFKGNVKPFANGDVIKGPTLFGLAGEAGTEAIMPLTRVGGKLGVQATGGGGDTMNLTVQAIDQQSGAQFLLKNLGTIQGGMQEQKALNGTGR